MKRTRQVLVALLMLGVELLASLTRNVEAQAIKPTLHSSSAQQRTLDLQITVPKYKNLEHSINIEQRQFEQSLQRRTLCSPVANASVRASPSTFFDLDIQHNESRGADFLGFVLAIPQMIQGNCFR